MKSVLFTGAFNSKGTSERLTCWIKSNKYYKQAKYFSLSTHQNVSNYPAEANEGFCIWTATALTPNIQSNTEKNTFSCMSVFINYINLDH